MEDVAFKSLGFQQGRVFESVKIEVYVINPKSASEGFLDSTDRKAPGIALVGMLSASSDGRG